MPGPVAEPTLAGFYGKLPARGDFVRVGLPRAFTDPWDLWLEDAMAVTKVEFGDSWLAAYLEAPVWRFSLPAGLCGPRPVLGLTMPSVDKAGRYFPLTFAAVSGLPDIDHTAADAWLDQCEDCGRNALETDAAPETMAADLTIPTLPRAAMPSRQSEWWSGGSVRLPPAQFSLLGLPAPRMFAQMLGMTPEPTVSVDSP